MGHSASTARIPVSLALGLGLVACGPDDASEEAPRVTSSPLTVAAAPGGTVFEERTVVELTSSIPAVIYYTTDGTKPSDLNGEVYERPLELTETTLLSFAAVAENRRWSNAGVEMYSLARPPMNLKPMARALSASERNLFFAVNTGLGEAQSQTIVVRSTGFLPVNLESIALSMSKSGSGFYDPSAFDLAVRGPDRDALYPGEELELEVTYRSTKTLASAAIVIRSDDERSEGVLTIDLWGRMITW